MPDPFVDAEHFTAAEWRRCSSRPVIYPPAELVWRLEDVRSRIGRPLPLLSGYRNSADNRRVGGARSSWHRVGFAVDVPVGLVPVDTALAAGFRGVGRRGSWAVHLDIRPGKTPVVFDD